ncbi:CPBP family intramembrane glutamic endopeptidase [Hyphomonas sp. FCG-A18]|uniref:CPBP family intramembrane glutamic endopeptidase n=1 Tax=Hyphomonas sp. FCG-A18 TaxID=3080019 RepID=UPI002B2F1F89|nr:CPBP family intramembrane glutamic endopeptidase [Hyphomonas sp. FCG-A18]
MQTTKYAIPIALIREPWTVAFFVICAPLLFPFVLTELATVLLPPDARSGIGVLWIVICLAMACQFAAVSIWSERIGAGAFGGRLKGQIDLFVAALFLGPLFLIGPTVMMSLLSGGQDGWQYADGVPPDVYGLLNWTPVFIFMAVVMAPVVEEVTFRGIGLGALIVRGVHPLVAVGIISAIFALMHQQYSLEAMFAVFLTGLGLGWLRLASGSVGVTIVAHMAANGNILLLQYAFTQAPAT